MLDALVRSIFSAAWDTGVMDVTRLDFSWPLYSLLFTECIYVFFYLSCEVGLSIIGDFLSEAFLAVYISRSLAAHCG